MKGLDSSSTLVHDFLQDAQTFLEQTLAAEKLSCAALEHRSRLALKLSALLKEYELQQMEMYIDMSPTLKSFFHPSPDGSSSSSTDSASIKEIQARNPEEFYEVPVVHDQSETCKTVNGIPSDVDQCDSSGNLIRTPETSLRKKTSFLHRFFKSTEPANKSGPTKQSEEPITAIYDDASAFSGSNSIYDDIVASRIKDLPDALYNDVSPVEPSVDVTYDDVVVEPGSLPLIYDDVLSSIIPPPPCENYDCVDDASLSGNNNDSDAVSLKSGTSEYCAETATHHGWNISASDAILQAVRHGVMKRRNGRKILSAWRRCYSVLLPAHLLMYATEGDSRPRIVISLGEPNICVRRLFKQGSDTKRIKTHPFVLLHEEKPLYEMSTKSREETEAWITALRSVISQPPKAILVEEAANDQEENVYDDPVEMQRHQERKEHPGPIQDRTLPSVPSGTKATVKSDSSSNSGKVLMANIFKFPRSRNGTTTQSGSSKRQSVERGTSTDDLYQELPSPVRSCTPYSSIDSNMDGGVAQAEEEEAIYHDVHSSTLSRPVCPVPTGGKSKSQEVLNQGDVNGSPRVPPIFFNGLDGSLPVYDIPSPTIRPVVEEFVRETDSVALIKSKSQLQPMILPAMPSSPAAMEVYDVPAANPKPVPLESERLRHPTGEAIVIEHATISPPPVTPTETVAIKQQKISRVWLDKVGETSSFRKELSPPKCLPLRLTQPPMTKSVGRSFSKTSTQRPPLAPLTELKAKVAKDNKAEMETFQNSFNKGSTTNTASSPTAYSSSKKEAPPRPPAPPARLHLKPTADATGVRSVMAELNQHVAKRQQRQISQNITPEALLSNKDNVSLSEKYKTRFAYVAQKNEEISLTTGEHVDVLSKNGLRWLVRTVNSKQGFVPRDYLIPLTTANPNSHFSNESF